MDVCTDVNLLQNANDYYEQMRTRRTIRRFNLNKVPLNVIKECVKVAGTAPSGANKQPWYFAIVESEDMKKNIRKLAEQEEYHFYHQKKNDRWINDLKPFGTSWRKPHLEEASALIIIFAKSYQDENKTEKCYYPKESVGIATGFLITAFHRLGISTLTHTPNPMSFLNQALGRPKNERPFLILAVGYKSENYELPDVTRKSLSEISDVF